MSANLSEIDQFSLLIGRLALAWARVERTQDTLVLQVFHHMGGKTIQAELPTTFSRKLKFLRKCFNNSNKSDKFKNIVGEFLGIAKLEAKFRNDCIHSVAAGVRSDGTAVFVTRTATNNTLVGDIKEIKRHDLAAAICRAKGVECGFTLIYAIHCIGFGTEDDRKVAGKTLLSLPYPTRHHDPTDNEKRFAKVLQELSIPQ